MNTANGQSVLDGSLGVSHFFYFPNLSMNHATFSFILIFMIYSAAGVPEALSSMAQYHLERGVASPFLVGPTVPPPFSLLNSQSTKYTARPHTHRTLEDLRKNLQLVGSLILSQGFPHELGPFIIGLTG
jgi:hypothetical protein